MKVMIIDLETENNPYYGDISSPRHPDNYVVAEGHCIEEVPFTGEVLGAYFNSKEASLARGWLHIPDDVDLLVAHNAPFEMAWALGTQYEEIFKFLARGGRVFCTAYAEYLLSHQQDTYPDLDTTAPKYGGTHKVNGIKILWEQGVLTSKIDPALLFDEYLLGPGGDIENTRKIFWGQWFALTERNMLNMALGRMEGMLFNCFAMYSGLYVNREVADKQKKEAEDKIAALQDKFRLFRTHIPDYVGFKDTSDFHMSAWLFGGSIKYKIKDTWFEDNGITPKYEKADYYKFGDTLVLPEDCDTAEKFQNMVRTHGGVHRYKSGKNSGAYKVFRENTSVVKQKNYDRVHVCAPLVDVSKFDKDTYKSFVSDFTGKRKLCDESPVFSTGKDCIEILLNRPEIEENIKELLRDLLDYAKIDKDLGTYYLREVCDEEGNVVKQSGMLQFCTPEGIVYHMLNVTSTVTGRLSSNRPNMQNIPRGDTSDVKNIFCSRFGDAGVILEADYSALEVVTLAAFSRDTNLIKALIDGIDMHCMRLSAQLNEPYEEVLKKCKDETHPEHKRYKTMRTLIKPRAFAYQYGASAAGIAYSTGCTIEDAQAFIDTEKALFPEVESYYEEVIFKSVENNTTIHREQVSEFAWRPYTRGVWQAPGGTCYEFREYPKSQWVDGHKVETMQFKPTQLRNYPIQGESGFFVQVVAGQIMRWLVSKNFYNGLVCIINQVHDAVYLDVHKSVLEEVARTVKYIMEALPETMKDYGYDLGVPFPAEVEAGPNMNDKRKVA